ncbi:MAG: DUF4276 family protein [Candidatus Asgardarchaeia archaeon]
MKIGLLVEGPIDKIVFDELKKKLNVILKIRVIDNKNKMFNLRKIKPHIISLLVDEMCNKVIVIIDRDDDDDKMLKNKFTLVKNNLENSLKESVFLCIVNKKIESWLLAAINGCSNSPENEENPEQKLSQCLGRKYLKGLKTTKRLAKKLSIEKLKRLCPSFLNFINILSDP